MLCPEWQTMKKPTKSYVDEHFLYWCPIIQKHNRTFYHHSPEEKVFYKVFALPKEGEPSFELTATDIFNRLQKRFPVLFRGANPKHFGKIMTKVGAKKMHTTYGTVYNVSIVSAHTQTSQQTEAA